MTLKKSVRVAVGFLFLLSLSGATEGAGRWVLLGTRTVTDRADHDTIVVTARRGDFHAIKITVRNVAVDFKRVVVHFASGGDQEIELRDRIPAGGESRVIDLRGGDRVIRSVDFWYDAHTATRRRGVVSLWART
ncbi:MAG TPA: hypothetical protein VJH03_27010 [Blastocatellia bacterium]|nr:hypothetical protein [Blastocatellia bacterium]